MSTTMTPRRCVPEDLMTIGEGLPADIRAVLDDYFGRFYAPIIPATSGMISGWKCICGEALTGFIGTFTYGLAHGEGYCRACKHPGRADHYIADASGEQILQLNRFPLLYFPADEVAP